MRSGRYAGDGYGDFGSVGFEFGDRLVGEPDPVKLAALEQTDDDFEQPSLGGKGVGHGAGFSEIIRGDGIGIADNFDIHDLQPALDQHCLKSSSRTDKAQTLPPVPCRETYFAVPKRTG